MKMLYATLTLVIISVGCRAAFAADPLPSWNDTKSKQAIVEFVEQVTRNDSPTFVDVPNRVATFDNDGTLWAEQPVYFQALYAIDQVQRRAEDHPEWRTTEPFKSAIEGDIAGIMAGGKEGLAKIVFASHANVTAADFSKSVREWLETAKHPKTGLLYKDMTYQPMLELLQYLRANGFKTFIVSGGGIDFLRVFAEEAYGIPPEQVVGSSLSAKFEMRDGTPTIVKLGEGLFVDDKEGKPVGIYQHIGRRPILAVGNSDGDLQMLQYATITADEEKAKPRLGVLIHHTDAEREWAYDRQSSIGRLDDALDQAAERRWVVVDMKKDWTEVFGKPNTSSTN